jgi:hypothetical protein
MPMEFEAIRGGIIIDIEEYNRIVQLKSTIG